MLLNAQLYETTIEVLGDLFIGRLFGFTGFLSFSMRRLYLVPANYFSSYPTLAPSQLKQEAMNDSSG